MLLKLDSKFFADFPSSTLDFSGTLGWIEEYLDKGLGSKIKRQFRLRILREESSEELVRIIFYLCVRSPLKSEFIHRVFDLPEKTQGMLMNDLKGIE